MLDTVSASIKWEEPLLFRSLVECKNRQVGTNGNRQGTGTPRVRGGLCVSARAFLSHPGLAWPGAPAPPQAPSLTRPACGRPCKTTQALGSLMRVPRGARAADPAVATFPSSLPGFAFMARSWCQAHQDQSQRAGRQARRPWRPSRMEPLEDESLWKGPQGVVAPEGAGQEDL